MRTRARAWLWLLVFAIAAVMLYPASCACEDDDDDDDDNDADDDDDDNDDDDLPDVDECLAEGRAWLAMAEGDRARLSFQCVLEQIPDHVEGQYGLVLSNTVHTNDVVGILRDYILSVIENGGPVKKSGEKYGGTDIIDRLLEIVLDNLMLDRTKELFETSDALQAVDGPSYTHEGIPIVFDFTDFGTMTGEFDRSFLSASEAYARLLYGLTGHLIVVSLDLDVSLAFAITEIDFSDTMTAIGDIIDILILFLEDPGHPDFLTMDEDQLALFASLGPTIGDGADEFLKLWAEIETETDDQTDDVIGYVDLDGSGAYDVPEPYFLPYFEVLEEDEMNALYALEGAFAALREAYWDRTPKDLDPDSPNPMDVGAVLNPILELLGLPAVIPDGVEWAVGDIYAEPDPRSVRDFVELLAYTLDGIIEGSGDYELPE